MGDVMIGLSWMIRKTPNNRHAGLVVTELVIDSVTFRPATARVSEFGMGHLVISSLSCFRVRSNSGSTH